MLFPPSQLQSGRMLILTVYLAIVGAAGLCYPRRPRAMGVLFVVAGGLMSGMWEVGAIGNNPPIIAAMSATLGLGTIWKFRDPGVRAAHVAEWTGKPMRRAADVLNIAGSPPRP